MLHRARCKTISELSGRASTFTGEYSKVCGAREDLESFARGLGGEAKPCRLCLRDFAVLSRSGGRYGPLRDFLAARRDKVASMTFSDIEALVGQLPASARQHRA